MPNTAIPNDIEDIIANVLADRFNNKENVDRTLHIGKYVPNKKIGSILKSSIFKGLVSMDLSKYTNIGSWPSPNIVFLKMTTQELAVYLHK